jgi:hypothetical protein
LCSDSDGGQDSDSGSTEKGEWLLLIVLSLCFLDEAIIALAKGANFHKFENPRFLFGFC